MFDVNLIGSGRGFLLAAIRAMYSLLALYL